MSFTAFSKRDMLNALNPTTLKLHVGYPGSTGANELTGGAPAYASKPCTFAVSAAGEPRALSGTVIFDVPASSIQWASAWTGTTMRFIAPTGGSPMEFATDLAANTVKIPAHGLVINEKVVFFLSAAPGGLSVGVIYFVVNATVDDFQVALTLGGAAINLTTTAAGDCLVSKIVPRVYATQDTHTVASYAFGLPY